MSNYEFWNELGKIFNAVVSYQEKSIEFNERFINPWIRIGNVFDRQDRQREEVRAYKQAAQIAPDNAQIWVDLGNAHYRNQSYDEAAIAFQKAIELDPKLGWPYSNLALVCAEQNKHVEAKALYEKSIQLLKDDREKAISWNRLGNLHRKLNEYELAIQAFQKADELDRENAGFKDVMNETLARSESLMDEPAQNDTIATSIQLIVEHGQSDEDERDATGKPACAQDETAALTDGPAREDEPSVGPNKPQPTDESNLMAGDAVPGKASLPGSADETGRQLGETPEPYVETKAASSAMEASDPTETLAAEALSHQVETYTAEITAHHLEDSKASDATPMISVVEETISTAPSAEENLPEVRVEIGDVETAGPVSPVAVEEPAAEIVYDGNPSNVVTGPAESIATADESVAATAETSKPDDTVAELTEPVAAVAIEESVAETAETAKVVEHVAEPVNPIEAVASEEVVSTSADVANMPEAVNDTPDHLAIVSAEEPVSETLEAADSDESVAKADEPTAPVALEEPIAEESLPAEAVAEAAGPLASAKTEKSAPEVAEAADSSETANAIGRLAYDEFLKDEILEFGPVSVQASPEMSEKETATSRKPMALIDESGEFQLEMDAKNAHVWNELGNVYFNRGAVEDAIIAYSKAIEIDRWFAWPYSNLALAYVQKGRFAEAMLLYQRSIELFTNDKDKAISWNRLGNVYRRLNDYDNAIAAYQRADELDPDNSTIYLQSRFSLLGNFQANLHANVNS